MANVLSGAKRHEVLVLGRLGRPRRRIEQATGVRRETASTYPKAAGIAVRAPGGWGRRPLPKPANEPSTASGAGAPAKPANGVSTDPAPAPWPPRPARSPQASACEPHREVIVEALGRGRNAMASWQDLVDQRGFAAGYASVQRFVKTLRAAHAPDAHPVILTAPGEEAQVAYGDGAMVRHPQTGKYRRTRRFILTSATAARRSGFSPGSRARASGRSSHVEGAYYSAPPGHLGERLPVQWDGVPVRLLDATTGQLLREHRWQAHGQYRIPPEDRPRRTPPEVAQLLARPARAGCAIAARRSTSRTGRSASVASSASSRSPSAAASRPWRPPAPPRSSAASRPPALCAATASASPAC
jgi:hypothetical protein